MNAVQMNTRMPEELKQFLLAQAKKEGRSLNNYLVRHFEELKMKLTSENAKA
ncbi:Arc family DNA-binding protein [Acinetobacter sp. Tr-809]|uniref:Arc family DNA-binding protein n=1 Tax=Acinetobacter sp. Tr-809 TaxID=2608324 RepID=UPI00141E4952|nr:Arc family DNA-binding protein [Acinetobacter sp. Tr-809]NIE95190.1 Arc family DNA-binding protein [Acinetobacter sp. Tr-809]